MKMLWLLGITVCIKRITITIRSRWKKLSLIRIIVVKYNYNDYFYIPFQPYLDCICVNLKCELNWIINVFNLNTLMKLIVFLDSVKQCIDVHCLTLLWRRIYFDMLNGVINTCSISLNMIHTDNKLPILNEGWKVSTRNLKLLTFTFYS